MRATVPVAALQSIVRIMGAMGHGAKGSEFGMAVGGGAVSLTVLHDMRVAVAKATFPMEGGPAEPVQMRHDLARFKKAVACFDGEDAVEVAFEGGPMTMVAGGRKSKVATVDLRFGDSPKFPELPWDTSATVPLTFLRDCAIRSSDIETATIAIRPGGLFEWDADDGMLGYSDSAQVESSGQFEGLFSPPYLADILAIACGEHVHIRAGGGLPLALDFDIGGGRASVVLAPRS